MYLNGLDAKIDQLHIFDKNDFLNGFNVSNLLCLLIETDSSEISKLMFYHK